MLVAGYVIDRSMVSLRDLFLWLGITAGLFALHYDGFIGIPDAVWLGVSFAGFTAYLALLGFNALKRLRSKDTGKKEGPEVVQGDET